MSTQKVKKSKHLFSLTFRPNQIMFHFFSEKFKKTLESSAL